MSTAISACCRGTRRCWPRSRSASCGYRKGQEKTYLAIAYGFAEVLPDRVTILAQLAERAEEIDVERAEAARDACVEAARPTSRTSTTRAPASR